MGKPSRTRVLSAREKRRRNEKAGRVDPFNPAEHLKLDYKLSIPGGALRSEYPATLSGSLVAATEADLARGIIVKLMEAFGYTRIPRAVTGLFAEVINPMSQGLRGQIAVQIAQGTGLAVVTYDSEACKFCGAEKQETEYLDPNIEDDDPTTIVDSTQHAEGCPTQVVEREEHDGEVPFDPEWVPSVTLDVLHPFKYQPLVTQGQPDGDVPVAVPEETTIDDPDKPIQFDSDSKGEEDDADDEA